MKNQNNTADQSQRVPTFSFAVDGCSADEFPAAPTTYGIGSGSFYARCAINMLGLGEPGRVVRSSMVHYNHQTEVAKLIHGLDRVL
jgi:selenocysteine lyase/cysteine desulfurase